MTLAITFKSSFETFNLFDLHCLSLMYSCTWQPLVGQLVAGLFFCLWRNRSHCTADGDTNQIDFGCKILSEYLHGLLYGTCHFHSVQNYTHDVF